MRTVRANSAIDSRAAFLRMQQRQADGQLQYSAGLHAGAAGECHRTDVEADLLDPRVVVNPPESFHVARQDPVGIAVEEVGRVGRESARPRSVAPMT